MEAQPRLPLAMPPVAMPGRTEFEVSTPCAIPFDGDDWIFSVDWEGSRCLLAAQVDGSITLAGETAALDARFPEIVAAGPLRGNAAAVLDGSICLLDTQGRPDLHALFDRVAGGSTGSMSAVYLATDLLHLNGESVALQPLRHRLAMLREVIPGESRIQLPDHVTGHGRALAAAATQQGLSAVIARREEAPYRAGMASPERLRIALSERRDVVVVGWSSSANPVRVILADFADGRLGLLGWAALESGPAVRWLAGAVEASSDPPVDTAAAGSGVTWVRPRLVATVEPPRARPRRLSVEMAEFALVALRDDVSPKWCVRRRPIDPPRASAQQPLRPFSPTVLSALPIDGAA
jgi:bifunctional non-homologous end joining protein LigD